MCLSLLLWEMMAIADEQEGFIGILSENDCGVFKIFLNVVGTSNQREERNVLLWRSLFHVLTQEKEKKGKYYL